jgi:hypothetical protein
MTTDELGEHGMVQIDEEAIRGFLSSQSEFRVARRSSPPNIEPRRGRCDYCALSPIKHLV